MASYVSLQKPLGLYKQLSSANIECLESAVEHSISSSNMASRLLRGLTVFLSGSALCASAKTETKNPFNDDFAKYMHNALDEWKTAGVAIGVVDGNDVFMEVSIIFFPFLCLVQFPSIKQVLSIGAGLWTFNSTRHKGNPRYSLGSRINDKGSDGCGVERAHPQQVTP